MSELEQRPVTEGLRGEMVRRALQERGFTENREYFGSGPVFWELLAV
jgi:hypothetical protein